MSDKSKLVADIIDNIRRVFQSVNEYSKKAERETGLTSPQLWAIKVIAEGAPIKVSELARRMYLHPATVVGILDRLEGRELVTRTRSKEDRRVVEIDLTEQGRELLTKSPEVAQGLLVKGLETLPTEKLRQLDDELLLLVKILGAQEIPPKLLLSPEVNLPKGNGLKAAARIDAPAKSREKAFTWIISSIIFLAILTTILLQATTTRWLAGKLGLLEEH